MVGFLKFGRPNDDVRPGSLVMLKAPRDRTLMYLVLFDMGSMLFLLTRDRRAPSFWWRAPGDEAA